MDKWQPMKSAPKQEGLVLLGLGWPEWPSDRTNIAPGIREMRCWRIGNSYGWSQRNGFGPEFTVGFKPTHWMPMPKPPAKRGAPTP